jgi:hypothetical protein
MDVEFLFTDWKPMSAVADKKYPQSRIRTRTLQLKSKYDTEQFIRNKIQQLKQFLDAPETQLPKCTPAELWQKPTTWAYFKNPTASKATKIFYSEIEAGARAAEDSYVGVVKIRPGKVKFCTYCSGLPICQQAEGYVQAGLLDT